MHRLRGAVGQRRNERHRSLDGWWTLGFMRGRAPPSRL